APTPKASTPKASTPKASTPKASTPKASTPKTSNRVFQGRRNGGQARRSKAGNRRRCILPHKGQAQSTGRGRKARHICNVVSGSPSRLFSISCCPVCCAPIPPCSDPSPSRHPSGSQQWKCGRTISTAPIGTSTPSSGLRQHSSSTGLTTDQPGT
ncbi:hypothetical protein PFISCL1PPCAC_20398, partial [Pristionchus fissidentatus]